MNMENLDIQMVLVSGLLAKNNERVTQICLLLSIFYQVVKCC